MGLWNRLEVGEHECLSTSLFHSETGGERARVSLYLSMGLSMARTTCSASEKSESVSEGGMSRKTRTHLSTHSCSSRASRFDQRPFSSTHSCYRQSNAQEEEGKGGGMRGGGGVRGEGGGG